MFGFFKKERKFSSPEEKLFHFFKTELEKEAIRNYKNSPMKDTPFGGYAILEGLTSAHEFFKKRTDDLSTKFGLEKSKVSDILTKAFRIVHDDLIE